MYRSSHYVVKNATSLKKVTASTKTRLGPNHRDILSTSGYIFATRPILNTNALFYSTVPTPSNEHKEENGGKKKSNFMGYLFFGAIGILTGVLATSQDSREIINKVPPLKMLDSKLFNVPTEESKNLLQEREQTKNLTNAHVVSQNSQPNNKSPAAASKESSSTPPSTPPPQSSKSDTKSVQATGNTRDDSMNNITSSYQALLEKKQSLLKELEVEVNHLRSYLIQTELYTDKRERQFEEISNELKHVKTYLINEELRTSMKDKEIDSLKNSLNNAQKIMENAIEALKEEHNMKILELNQLHEAELKEVEGSLDVVLEDQKKSLEKEFLMRNQSRIERLKELTEKVYAVEEVFHRSSSYLMNSVRLQKLTAAVLALQQVLKSDAPFLPEMKILSEEGYGDRLIEEMVYAIPKEIQKEGLPCRHDLYREFCKIDRKVLEASYIPTSAGFFGLLYSKIVGKFLIQENGLVDGDTVDAKLARARVYLLNDKLSLALQELSDIKGEAREVLQPWLSQAQYRLIADQSIEILHAHITNLSASLIQ